MAEATFISKENNDIIIDHVYVNEILRGKGVAQKIMEVMVEYLRKEGIKASATCSYANGWLKKNKELYSDIMASDNEEQIIACKINGKH